MRIFVRTALMAVAVMLVAASVTQAQQFDPVGSYVQDVQYDNGGGRFNWTTGFITATGFGAPPANAVNIAQANAMARRAAIVVARRNLLETIKGVHIDSVTLVKDHIAQDDRIESRVRGFLQNSQVLEVHYLSDGAVEAKVGIRMHGPIADTVMPQNVPFRPGPVTPSPAPAPVPAPSMGAQPQAPTAYTGLLVDARGLNARPAMSPKLVDQSGQEIYGSAMVSRDYAIQQGMAGYAKDLDQARENPRITANPLVLKAKAVKGQGRTNLVIDSADAEALRNAAKDKDFLEKCRVMIVLD